MATGNLCEGCNFSEYQIVALCYNNNVTSIDFFRKHGVLPISNKCPRCNGDLKLSEKTHMWRCSASLKQLNSNKRNRCGFKISDFNGSFLENSKLQQWQILLFINGWLKKKWNHSDIRDNLKISQKTSVDWRSFCSEVTLHAVDTQMAIGGPNCKIEIDESLISKRKYHKGRLIKQIWVFGGINRESKKFFIIPLLEEEEEEKEQNEENYLLEKDYRDAMLKRLPRDKPTLESIIQKYILPGSIIYSDEWAAYNSLSELGYGHKVIKHKENFVHPEDPDIHTQNIERLWRDFKEWVKRPGMSEQYLKQYLSRFLFARQRPKSRLLHDFLVEAGKLYVPGSQN